MGQLVIVREYFDRLSAEISRSMLEAHGIMAHVEGDDMGGMRPDILFAGKVRLLVPSELEADATALLEAADVAENQTDEPEEPGDRIEQPGHTKLIRRAFFASILGLFILPPVIMHLYALLLLGPVLKGWRGFSQNDKIKAGVAGAISCMVLVVAIVLFWHWSK